jgi:hypothetical protein
MSSFRRLMPNAELARRRAGFAAREPGRESGTAVGLSALFRL